MHKTCCCFSHFRAKWVHIRGFFMSTKISMFGANQKSISWFHVFAISMYDGLQCGKAEGIMDGNVEKQKRLAWWKRSYWKNAPTKTIFTKLQYHPITHSLVEDISVHGIAKSFKVFPTVGRFQWSGSLDFDFRRWWKLIGNDIHTRTCLRLTLEYISIEYESPTELAEEQATKERSVTTNRTEREFTTDD